MFDTYFIIQIFASVIALIASYAFLMSLLKRELNTTWIRGEAVLLLITSVISLSLYYPNLFDFSNKFSLSSALFLSLTALISFLIVVTHRFKMRNDKETYPESLIHIAKIAAMVSFATITLHLLFEIASLAWG